MNMQGLKVGNSKENVGSKTTITTSFSQISQVPGFRLGARVAVIMIRGMRCDSKGTKGAELPPTQSWNVPDTLSRWLAVWTDD